MQPLPDDRLQNRFLVLLPRKTLEIPYVRKWAKWPFVVLTDHLSKMFFEMMKCEVHAFIQYITRSLIPG